MIAKYKLYRICPHLNCRYDEQQHGSNARDRRESERKSYRKKKEKELKKVRDALFYSTLSILDNALSAGETTNKSDFFPAKKCVLLLNCLRFMKSSRKENLTESVWVHSSSFFFINLASQSVQVCSLGGFKQKDGNLTVVKVNKVLGFCVVTY